MSNNLKLKICGMRDKQNIQDLLAINPDFVGFIFYEKSSRDATNVLDVDLLLNFPKSIKKVGVFVDATLEFIIHQQQKFGLDFIQLHGNETPEFCEKIKLQNLKIIKAFAVDAYFDFYQLEKYANDCDYFLFDTKGINPGGNGIKFDWNILINNPINKPFFLSGGIELADINEVPKLKMATNNFFALDVNSKFETAPAIKNIAQIAQLNQVLNAY